MIVIYTPYGRNEVTVAALRVADIAVEHGLDVRVVAVGVHEHRVHPFWDSKVISGKYFGVHGASGGASQCIWFLLSEELLSQARLRAPDAVQTLVPSWHSLRPSSADIIRKFDRVIAPSKTCFNALKACVFKGVEDKSTLLSWARWESGLPFTPRGD